MIPAAFDYARADSVEEAIALLVEHGDEAKLVAGGHSLVPLMKLRLATPSVLIDLGRIPGLSYIEERGDEIAIGALARHHDLETSALLKEQVPLLAFTAHQVGDPQVRHRGTLGGTLAHGDPASDLPAAILALGGTLVAPGPGLGDRRRGRGRQRHDGYRTSQHGVHPLTSDGGGRSGAPRCVRGGRRAGCRSGDRSAE